MFVGICTYIPHHILRHRCVICMLQVHRGFVAPRRSVDSESRRHGLVATVQMDITPPSSPSDVSDATQQTDNTTPPNRRMQTTTITPVTPVTTPITPIVAVTTCDEPMLRVLTIKQPWSNLIVNGEEMLRELGLEFPNKSVENRGKNLLASLGSPFSLLIHSAQAVDDNFKMKVVHVRTHHTHNAFTRHTHNICRERASARPRTKSSNS